MELPKDPAWAEEYILEQFGAVCLYGVCYGTGQSRAHPHRYHLLFNDGCRCRGVEFITYLIPKVVHTKVVQFLKLPRSWEEIKGLMSTLIVEKSGGSA